MTTSMLTQPQPQFHCCEANKCLGSRYHELFLRCRCCKKKMMIECLRNRDSARTRTILNMFDIIRKSENDNGTHNWVILDHNPNKSNAFCEMFNGDSLFGFTCEICSHKFTEFLDSSSSLHSEKADVSTNTEQNDLNDQLNTIVIDIIEKYLDDKFKSSSTQKGSIDEAPCKNKKPDGLQIEPVNDVFSIHLSNFSKETTSDELIALLTSKLVIDPESLHVEKLQNKRYHGKSRKFSSFKISTFSREICNKIFNTKSWESNCIVKPFIQNTNQQIKNQNISSTGKPHTNESHTNKQSQTNITENQRRRPNYFNANRYQFRENHSRENQRRQFYFKEYRDNSNYSSRNSQFPQFPQQHYVQNPVQQPLRQQLTSSNNYSFWNGVPYHISPPQPVQNQSYHRVPTLQYQSIPPQHHLDTPNPFPHLQPPQYPAYHQPQMNRI